MSEDYRGPWDPGLPLERTTLAWLRTALAFLVGFVFEVRFIATLHPVVAIGSALLATPIILLIVRLARRRSHRGEECLHTATPLPDGALPAAVTTLAVLVGGGGLAWILLG